VRNAYAEESFARYLSFGECQLASPTVSASHIPPTAAENHPARCATLTLEMVQDIGPVNPSFQHRYILRYWKLTHPSLHPSDRFVPRA
jgi:hypothetical protein